MVVRYRVRKCRCREKTPAEELLGKHNVPHKKLSEYKYSPLNILWIGTCTQIVRARCHPDEKRNSEIQDKIHSTQG